MKFLGQLWPDAGHTGNSVVLFKAFLRQTSSIFPKFFISPKYSLYALGKVFEHLQREIFTRGTKLFFASRVEGAVEEIDASIHAKISHRTDIINSPCAAFFRDNSAIYWNAAYALHSREKKLSNYSLKFSSQRVVFSSSFNSQAVSRRFLEPKRSDENH